VRVVADTNTLVSGMLWRGAPRQVLDAARSGSIQLYTSATLLDELEGVLKRDKFAQRLALANITPHELILGFASLARLVKPAEISPVILEDSDDDAVLACALSAQADYIVSGDSHLLNLHRYQSIPILTASELLAKVV
jgi:putative PIN family toxin of toxin-antitoxin system